MPRVNFIGPCDRFRQTPRGEVTWQLMMRTRKEIAESTFRAACNVSYILDEGETWAEYKRNCAMQGDPIKFYKSAETGLYFFQTAGFEFIWGNPTIKNKERM